MKSQNILSERWEGLYKTTSRDFTGLGKTVIFCCAVIVLGLALVIMQTVQGWGHDVMPGMTKEQKDVAEFYAGWKRPDLREKKNNTRWSSCCNKTDCHEVDVKTERGIWFFKDIYTQQWFPIPADKLEDNQPDPRESPDGKSHVCYSAYTTSSVAYVNIFCAVLGSLI